MMPKGMGVEWLRKTGPIRVFSENLSGGTRGQPFPPRAPAEEPALYADKKCFGLFQNYSFYQAFSPSQPLLNMASGFRLPEKLPERTQTP